MRLQAIAALAAAATLPTAGVLAFSPHVTTPDRSITARPALHMSSESGGGGGDSSPLSMAGKVAYQRFLYRLSPLSDCPETPYSVEERLRFRVADDGRTLEPYGPTTYILRDGPPLDDDDEAEAKAPEERRPDGGMRKYVRIGRALYKLNVKQGEGETEETSEDSCVAMALFLAARPDLVKGNVLQLGAGSGLGGILGCVAAGIGSAKAKAEAEAGEQDSGDAGEEVDAGDDTDDNILPSHDDTAPLPPSLTKLYLSDSSETNLNHALHNCKKAGLSPSKVELVPFDFRGRLPSDMRSTYDLILGTDLAYQFPDVKHIARTVAYSLKPSPYAGQMSNEELEGGRVVHVGPNTRDAISELRRKMRRGYRIDTDVAYLDLRRYDLAPMVLDSEADEEGAELDMLSPPREDGLGRNGFVEYQNEVDSKFTGFVGCHHMDYDGYNGEYFFPAETGAEEDGTASRWVGEGNVERDEGYRKTDEGKGSWYFEE